MATINGSSANNNLSGTASGDSIFGNAGSDTLFGNGGNDSLYGGDGNDLLDGGADRDLLNGGSGNDTVTYATVTVNISLSLFDGLASFPTTVWGSETLALIENAITGAGNDTLAGTDGANYLVGGAGDDLLMGGGGADTLDGGAGSDQIYGDFDPDSSWYWWFEVNGSFWKPDVVDYRAATRDLTALLDNDHTGTVSFAGLPSEQDTLIYVESIWGGSGRDSLVGSNEGNELRGGNGADTLVGMGGDDTLWGQGGTDRIDGGAGSDTVVYSDNTTSVKVDLGTARLATFPGQTWPSESLISIENAVTGSGKDTLVGGSAANILDGGLAADRIDGGGGSDTASFASHSQAVRVDLSLQRATIVGTTVQDTLVSIENAIGSTGNDIVIGSASANNLDGSLGNDSISGASGNDILKLSVGNDTLDGGAGIDTLQWDRAYQDHSELNYYRQFEFEDPSQREDYSGDTDIDVSIDLRQGVAVASFEGGGVSVLRNVENVNTGVGNDHVFGSDAANVISVGHGANYVEGRGGNDLIQGANVDNNDDAYDFHFADSRDRSEVLKGGVGNDTIVGGARMSGDEGNDTLIAGWGGNDTGDGVFNIMTGGAGADKFVFSDAFWADGWHSWEVLSQRGTILDLNYSDGDRIVVDRTDNSAPQPEYVGHVDSYFDVPVGSYGWVGSNTLFVALVEGGDFDGPFTDGIKIEGLSEENSTLLSFI